MADLGGDEVNRKRGCFKPCPTATACFVASQGCGGLRGRCAPRSCRLERQGRGAERGVGEAAQAPRPRPRAWAGHAPRLEGVGARPPGLGAVGPLKALQAHFVGTCGGGRVVGAWGGRKENSPRRGKIFFNGEICPPPQLRKQNFLPAGDFFYPNPPLSPLSQQAPTRAPPFGPPNATPTPLLRRLHKNCPGYHGQAWPITCPQSWGRLTERWIPSTTAPTVTWIVHMYMYRSTLIFGHHRSLKEKRLRPWLNVQKRRRELHPSALRRTRYSQAQRL